MRPRFVFSLIFAVTSAIAQAEEPYGIRAKYATPAELSTTNLAPGELVLNTSEPSDLRVGDGGTPGGQSVGAWVMEALREDPDFLHDIGGATADETKAFLALSVANQRAGIAENAGNIHSNAVALSTITNALGQRVSANETVKIGYTPATRSSEVWLVPTNCPTRNLEVYVDASVYNVTNNTCTIRIPAAWMPNGPMTVRVYAWSSSANSRFSFGIGNVQHVSMAASNARELEYQWMPECSGWQIRWRAVQNGFNIYNTSGSHVSATKIAALPASVEEWVEWRQQKEW